MRMAILDYGLFEIYGAGRRIGIPGYYIESGDRRILIDTGFHRDYVANPKETCLADGLGAFGELIDYTESQNPVSQLALLGVRPTDITDLVLTHGHIDHVGRIDAFPAATLYVSAIERALPEPYYWGARSRIGWPAIPTTRVDAELQIAAGVRLVPTPGHTFGHLSVIVRLPELGKVVLTADAISRPEELADDTYADAADPHLARTSAHALMQRAKDARAWVIYGHSPQQWQVLRKAPYWYA